MKYLLLILLLISCNSEMTYKDLSTPVDKDVDLGVLSKKIFKPKIEMMILFLWPKDLSFTDEDHVIKIISTSREIAINKDQYLRDLYLLDRQYQDKSCDCQVLGLCDDDQQMDDDLLIECEQITSKQDENNLILADLTQSHEVIKSQLNEIGAINIDVGMDEDYLNIGSLDPKSKELHLNKFGFKSSKSSLDFKLETFYDQVLKAKFEFKVDKDVFSGELGITEKEYNVIFQGDIETNTGYRGLIYWEHLK